MNITPRKPPWLRRKIAAPGKSGQVNLLLHDLSLHTVCQEAHCPNQGECYAQGTATFLLLGPACTRNCAFCAVQHQGHRPPDPGEPGRTAEAVARMGLNYCVLTMVTRDDLPDGGARHVAETITAIRRACPGALIEVLISDLGGDPEALEVVLAARPEVLNHNVETVPRLYPAVRPQAGYRRSLELIGRAQAAPSRPVTKSGLMVGLGETREELQAVFHDLRAAGCDLLTLGQYLAPSDRHHPVVRFVPPEEFEELADDARRLGFKACASGPYVRSSYQAAELYQQALNQRD
jgi:lipoic acid synthetase